MRQARTSSLAGRLFGRVLLLVSLIGMVMASIAFWAARQQIARESDAALVTSANVLYALTQRELKDRGRTGRLLSIDESLLSGEELRSFEKTAHRRMFAISRSTRPLLRSDTGPPARLLPSDPGFATISAADGAWRIYGLAVPPQHLLIQVGERVALRQALLANIAANMLIPLVLLVIGSGFLLWISLQDGLLQLRQLSQVLSQRSPRDTARLQESDWPVDLRPLVTTLNALFERVDSAFWLERRFTDDAAHQLRTPLAALRLQVQALALARDDGERKAWSTASLAAVDRASLLVGQMLALARLDAGEVQIEALDLVAVLSECIADQAAAADGADIAIDYVGPTEAVGNGDATALRLIFSNLIENAVKYSSPGMTVQISIDAHAEDSILVSVSDQGPGIADDKRADVLRRFHRETGDQAGFGLGLAIVASAVRLLGATLTLTDNPASPGLLAIVELPR